MPTEHLPPVHVTPQQAADRCGVSVATVKRWIAQGQLPAERLGDRLLRIRVEDLNKLFTPVR